MTNIDQQVFYLLGTVSDEVFFICNTGAGRLEYLGPGFEKYVSLPAKDIQANPNQLFEIVHPDDREHLLAQLSIFNRQKRLRAEVRIILPKGDAMHVQLTVYQLPGGEGKVAGWLTDIDNVKNNILYAEKINARKNSMLEVLSHDLKEPVSMINMMATAIKRDMAVAGNQTLETYLQVIQDLCDSNIRLIRGLVQQEFLEANEVGLRMESADLIGAIRDVMRQYEASAAIIKKQFRFETELPRLLITMDTLKIIQVVNNLISNAIKFTTDGGLIVVRVIDRESLVRITVSDDGIGIPAELQPHLFEPHSPAQRPGVRGEEGSGMGLAIIRSLVQLHGGRVWLDTQLTKGTAFHIELPKV